jgi:hypothetical protein
MYSKNENKIGNTTSINIHTLMEDIRKKEKEDFSAQLDATIWLQTMMSKSSWRTQMPKSDKKENIMQL